MSLRKYTLMGLSFLLRDGIYSAYKTTQEWDMISAREVQERQQVLLRSLLAHAYKSVPYYRNVLSQTKVYDGSGAPDLARFSQMPVLTKGIIRDEAENLLSQDWKRRGGKPNTSGGSTGEPVRFIQDRAHRTWCVYANKLYFNHMLGKEMGESEINLWGSERDIQCGSIGFRKELINLVYNRRFLNAFRMNDSTKAQYLQEISESKPAAIWAYVESIHELALFADQNGITVEPPNMIIATAGTLYEPVRQRVERVFGAPVYNQYGSREVGPIACECVEQSGLHLFPWTHLVEVVDDNDKPCAPGTEGDIVVTNLVNYAMPLIRYRIGDRGALGNHCSCGRPTPVLKAVTGRTVEHLVASDGARIHGQYIIHLYYHKDWVQKFQVHQTERDTVVNRIVVTRKPVEQELREIERQEKAVIGEHCNISFEIVEDIPPTASGKYLYVLSDVEP